MTGKTLVDTETQHVTLTDLTVTQLDFSTLAREELATLALEVGKTLLLDADPVKELADKKRISVVTVA